MSVKNKPTLLVQILPNQFFDTSRAVKVAVEAIRPQQVQIDLWPVQTGNDASGTKKKWLQPLLTKQRNVTVWVGKIDWFTARKMLNRSKSLSDVSSEC